MITDEELLNIYDRAVPKHAYVNKDLMRKYYLEMTTQYLENLIHELTVSVFGLYQVILEFCSMLILSQITVVD